MPIRDFRFLIISILAVSWIQVDAQNSERVPESFSDPEIEASGKFNSVGNVDFGILGSSYSKEWLIRSPFALRGDLGIGGRILSWGPMWELTDVDKYYLALHPSIGVSTRYYYNKKRLARADLNLKTLKYISVRGQIIPPLFIKTISSFRGWPFPEAPGSFEIIPQWGFRSEGARVYFEMNMGYNIYLDDVFRFEWYEDAKINFLCRVGLRL